MVHVSCDRCGREIGGAPNTLRASTGENRRLGIDTWTAHYCDACWPAVDDALSLAEQAGRDPLEAIPTASGQKIAALRRRHASDGGEVA